MMNPSHKKIPWLAKRLQAAINTFNDSADVFLLMDEEAEDGKSHGSVGERSVAHRLSVYLENELKMHGYPNEDTEVAIDSEYNRHRGAVKEHLVNGDLRKRVEAAKEKILKEHPEKKGWYVFTILPDIIAHQRGDDDYNLIVVELKRASNTVDDELDNLKLLLFTTQDYMHGYGYMLGASVIAYDEDQFGKRRLEVSKFYFDPKALAA